MSITLMTLVSKAPLGRASRKAVAHKLADFAADNGNSIFPSNDRVAQETGLSKRSVQRAISLFLRKGLLIKIAQGGSGRGSTCHYELDVDLLRRLGSDGTSLDALPDVDPTRRGRPAVEKSPNARTHPLPSSGCQADTARVTASRQKGVTQTPNPSESHQLAVSTAATAPLADLETRLREAAGASIDVARVKRNCLPPVLEWLKAGIDLDRDILPAVRAKSRLLAKGHVWSWRYFDRSVRAWHARRMGSAVTTGSATPPPDPSTFTESGWRRRLDYHRSSGRWFDEWGPEPGEESCFVPPHLLTDRDTA